MLKSPFTLRCEDIRWKSFFRNTTKDNKEVKITGKINYKYV